MANKVEDAPPILVVDDSTDELMLMQRIIQTCKILNEVCLFETGRDCVDYFEKDSRRDQPEGCILLLDMMMTPTSGLEVLERIQGLPSAKKSLLVMVSGLSDIKAINTGYQLGAHTFMIKPLKPDDVVQLLAGMQNRVWVEERSDGYVIRLVPESETSFIKKPGLSTPFVNWAGRLREAGGGEGAVRLGGLGEEKA